MSINDLQAIHDIVVQQFASMNWTAGTAGNWEQFSADFLPGAVLYPSARPPKSQIVDEFLKRMKGLQETTLRTFAEAAAAKPLIHIFGNVAVVVAAGEFVQNGREEGRTVEMMLLVKSAGEWRIAAQAWDHESPSNQIPDAIFGGKAA